MAPSARSLALTLLLLSACQAPPPPGTGNGAALQPPPVEPENAPARVEIHPEPEPPSAPPARPDPQLLRNPALAKETAPERFTVLFSTTQGELHLDVRRSWAPLGADRLYNLVRAGYFDDNAFFRVIGDFVAQFGIHGDPEINEVWRGQRIADDPAQQSNIRGMVCFATSGKNSRTTQLFIDLGDNPGLDRLGFAPLGRVRELDVARKLFAGYGEGAPGGHGPLQARIMREGNAYLRAEFPKLDYVKSATIQ